METSSAIPWSLITFIGLLIITLVSILFYFRQNGREKTGVKAWINDSNYNISTSDDELAAIEKASPEEAIQMLQNITENKGRPVSDDVFNALRKKVREAER